MLEIEGGCPIVKIECVLEYKRNINDKNLITLRGDDIFITNEEMKEQYRPDHQFFGISRQLTKKERQENKEATGVDLSPCYVARKWDSGEDSFFINYSSSRIYIGDQRF